MWTAVLDELQARGWCGDGPLIGVDPSMGDLVAKDQGTRFSLSPSVVTGYLRSQEAMLAELAREGAIGFVGLPRKGSALLRYLTWRAGIDYRLVLDERHLSQDLDRIRRLGLDRGPLVVYDDTIRSGDHMARTLEILQAEGATDVVAFCVIACHEGSRRIGRFYGSFTRIEPLTELADAEYGTRFSHLLKGMNMAVPTNFSDHTSVLLELDVDSKDAPLWVPGLLHWLCENTFAEAVNHCDLNAEGPVLRLGLVPGPGMHELYQAGANRAFDVETHLLNFVDIHGKLGLAFTARVNFHDVAVDEDHHALRAEWELRGIECVRSALDALEVRVTRIAGWDACGDALEFPSP